MNPFVYRGGDEMIQIRLWDLNEDIRYVDGMLWILICVSVFFLVDEKLRLKNSIIRDAFIV